MVAIACRHIPGNMWAAYMHEARRRDAVHNRKDSAMDAHFASVALANLKLAPAEIEEDAPESLRCESPTSRIFAPFRGVLKQTTQNPMQVAYRLLGSLQTAMT